jgi:hypothetical protein
MDIASAFCDFNLSYFFVHRKAGLACIPVFIKDLSFAIVTMSLGKKEREDF